MLFRPLIAKASPTPWFGLVYLLLLTHSLSATTITVMNTNDSGTGSLRQAIADAAFGGTIEFDASLANETITLTSDHLLIARDLTIDGQNTPNLTLDGNNTYRLFRIGWFFNGTENVPITVTIKNLNLINGRATGMDEAGAGGGIYILGVGNTVTVENCVFENNLSEGEGGAAIYSGNEGTLTVTNCTFSGNTAETNGDPNTDDAGERGGTVSTNGLGTLTVTGSTFQNNVGVNGAGINTVDTNLLVEDCTFENNDTQMIPLQVPNPPAMPDTRAYGFGAAIYTDGANRGETTKFQTIRNCTFTNNVAHGNGGAVFFFGYADDVLTVEDCTFTGNEVVVEGFSTFQSSFGGGMRISGGGQGSRTGTLSPMVAYVRRCTFNDNTSENSGGGLWTQITDGGSIEIENCTIDNNRSYFGDFSTGTNNATSSTPRGNGGGLNIALSDGSTALLNNITVTNNVASWQGGGINLGSGDGQTNTTITNTISAYNEAENGGNTWNIKHNINAEAGAGSHNMQSNELGTNLSFLDSLTATGTTIADPLLDPLADNGGTTQTSALQTGSPAIDAGNGSTCASTDQRGGNRVSNCDIGAYESDAVILPVSLTTFEAHLVDKDVVLAWQTALEVNNLGFEIERSANAKHWLRIGFVAGNSTTQEKQAYTFRDENPIKGTNYYRLKQLDFDGMSTYSDIVAVTYQLIPNPNELFVYPNPTSQMLTYEVAGVRHLQSVQLFDMLGKRVKMTTQTEGQLSLADLEAGTYVLVVEAKEQTWRKLVIRN